VKRIGVITNPAAGSGRGKRLGAEAISALAERGHQVLDLTRGSWAGAYEAALHHRRDIDALVVVGGDGMVHLGIQICAGKKLPLGIIAAGSGNDAAKALGLPEFNLNASVALVESGLEGDMSAIDLGVITGPSIQFPAKERYFMAVLSAGIDAAIAAYGSNLVYPRGPLKYKVATLRELPRFKPYGVKVRVDGIELTQQCTLVAVANAPVFGGGLRISPTSQMQDGYLELVLADPMSKRDILKIFPKLYDGSHIDDPRVRIVKAKEIFISQSHEGARLPVAFADGEMVGAEPLRVRCAPGALRVLGARTA